jgi:hypothetical protein
VTRRTVVPRPARNDDWRPCSPWANDVTGSEWTGDIESLLGSLGIDGRITNDEITAPCPMHADRRPSFGVNMNTGLWICRAGCGKGNLAQLLAIATGITVGAARAWLGETEAVEYAVDDSYDADCEHVYYDEWDRLRKPPPAWALESRRITEKAAAQLGIGWGPAWHPDLRIETRASGWVLPMTCLGCREVRGFQNKIDVSEWPEEVGVWSGAPKRLSLFGVTQYQGGTTVMVVESPLDVAVLRSARLPALATYGAPSRPQLRYLAENAGRIVLAFDNDDAGLGYLDDVIRSGYLARKIHDGDVYRFVCTGGGKDPGEVAQKLGYSALRDGLKSARHVRTR